LRVSRRTNHITYVPRHHVWRPSIRFYRSIASVMCIAV
jgi:hypothetical protein